MRIFDESTIKDLDGKFERDEKLAGRRIIGVSFAGSRKFGDESIRLLKELKSLRALLLFGNQITDVGLQELSEFRKLGFLNLSETRITDAGLMELRELKNLQRLDLRRAKTTDASVKQLEEFTPNVNNVR